MRKVHRFLRQLSCKSCCSHGDNSPEKSKAIHENLLPYTESIPSDPRARPKPVPAKTPRPQRLRHDQSAHLSSSWKDCVMISPHTETWKERITTIAEPEEQEDKTQISSSSCTKNCSSHEDNPPEKSQEPRGLLPYTEAPRGARQKPVPAR